MKTGELVITYDFTHAGSPTLEPDLTLLLENSGFDIVSAGGTGIPHQNELRFQAKDAKRRSKRTVVVPGPSTNVDPAAVAAAKKKSDAAKKKKAVVKKKPAAKKAGSKPKKK